MNNTPSVQRPSILISWSEYQRPLACESASKTTAVTTKKKVVSKQPALTQHMKKVVANTKLLKEKQQMPSPSSSRSPPPPATPGSSFRIPKKMSSPPATPRSTLGSTPSTQGRRRGQSSSPGRQRALSRAPHRPPSSLGPEKREYLNTTAEAKRFKLYTNEHV
ncbi:unnamed protein product, partial [Adineta steineri]